MRSLLNYIDKLRELKHSELVFFEEFHNSVTAIVESELESELNNSVQKKRILTKSENIDFIP